jgi:hypothetical protein
MTYRARASGRRARRQAHKETLIQQQAARRPPRVVYQTIYEPARPPHAKEERDGEGNRMFLYEVGDRPRHRVIEVPIAPRGSAAAMIQLQPDPERFVRRVQLQAEEWGFSQDSTRVRWWSWKPVGDGVTAEKVHAMSRCLAYAERAKQTIDGLYRISADDDAMASLARSIYYGEKWTLRELVNWLKVVVEDVEQLRGMP